jgi:multiple sugar transport system substrate-binding protein
MNSQEELTAFQGYREARRIRDDVTTPSSVYLQKTQESLLPLTTARPNDPNYNKVSAEIQRMTESVVSGELSPQDAMAAYKAAVIGIVGEENTVSKL